MRLKMLENDYNETINKDNNQCVNDISCSENESERSERDSKIKQGQGYENIEYQCLDEDNFVECFEDDFTDNNTNNIDNFDTNKINQEKDQEDLPEQKVIEQFTSPEVNIDDFEFVKEEIKYVYKPEVIKIKDPGKINLNLLSYFRKDKISNEAN